MWPGGGLHDTLEAAGARGEGLEPSITGPEPVVLPITPPPNGWAFRLPERPMAGVRPADGPGGAAYREGLGGKMRRPGVSRESMVRRSSACMGGRERESPWLG